MTGRGRRRRAATFTPADLAYIRAEFVTLEEVCAGRPERPDDVRALIATGALPQPTYVLDDGAEIVPGDYFALVDEAGGPEKLRRRFEERFAAAGGRGEELEETWRGYMSGTYGVCLREVTPEAMVRKDVLVEAVGGLLAEPRPDDEGWRDALRTSVGELDALEREFAPDYDRDLRRLPRPPTRDTLIRAPRRRYPDVFSPSGRRTPA
jgi:hypothetical protein